MTDAMVSIQNVGKKYCRSLKRSLWYGVQDMASELSGRPKKAAKLRKDEFWALKDITFDVKKGDTIGLIGRNGAGKTTLLRLMSGLNKPDTGRITVRGRMQALIALGAGFNPVLTGRENVYINAAVLGIPKKEVDRRFDEIVDFSGIEEFIDSPVQSYSSGMNVRLGFSVAVHMEPDILLVDEVLAVGDIPFRSKCHRKLGELKERGIPWIMVSHDMGIIRNQTNKCIYLEKGHIKYIGTPDDTISTYLYSISEQEYTKRINNIVESPAQESQLVRIHQVRLLDTTRQEKDFFQTGEPLIVEIEYEAFTKVERPSFGVHIYNVQDENLITGVSTADSNYQIDSISGHGKIYYQMPSIPLLPGIFRVRVDIWDKRMGMLDKKSEAAYLHVKNGLFSVGTVFIPHTWQLEAHEYSPHSN